MIHYRVSLPNPHSHTLSVELRIPAPAAQTSIHLPVWTPGSYLVREFSRYLSEATVEAVGGGSATIEKTAKGSWQISSDGAHEVIVRYTAYCHERSVRTPHVDGSHAFFTGTNLLCFVDGRTTEPHRLSVDLPPGWRIFTSRGLDVADFTVADYDTLADLPVELGPDHLVASVEILGKPHDLVFWGAEQTTINLPRLLDDTRALVEANAAMFGGSLPYERYLFIYHVSSDQRGGLEHLDSTVLAAIWKNFENEESYRDLLGLISHEHFHVWNVKRIRPKALGPFNYLAENHTTGLWISEGATSYFDNLNALRAGRFTAQQWLKFLEQDLQRYFAIPGRFEQSVALASFDAWTRLYRPDENTNNRTISYYLKGAMVSLALDLTIRDATAGERCFDDLLGLYWRRFCGTGEAFDEGRVVEDLRTATGLDLSAEIATWVYGTEDPPFAALLASHGVELRTTLPPGSHTGLDTTQTSEGLRVTHVHSTGANAGGGIYPQDTLVAVAGRRVLADGTREWLAAQPAGTTMAVHLFRRDRLVETELRLGPPTGVTVTLEATATQDAAILERRRRWLGL